MEKGQEARGERRGYVERAGGKGKERGAVGKARGRGEMERIPGKAEEARGGGGKGGKTRAGPKGKGWVTSGGPRARGKSRETWKDPWTKGL